MTLKCPNPFAMGAVTTLLALWCQFFCYKERNKIGGIVKS
jgi:hypothetical protein